MNDVHPGEEQSSLLTDSEFAKLMMAEYSAELRKNPFISRSLFRTQIALWAAGLGAFVIYQPHQPLALSDEFSLTNGATLSIIEEPQGRTKSGGASLKPLPELTVDFELLENSGTPSEGTGAAISALGIRARHLRRLRIEIHENGILKKIRELDSLSLPTEQRQSALVSGDTWGFKFEEATRTLVCVKPSDAPRPPERLSVDEMKQRAALFPSQCFFQDR